MQKCESCRHLQAGHIEHLPLRLSQKVGPVVNLQKCLAWARGVGYVEFLLIVPSRMCYCISDVPSQGILRTRYASRAFMLQIELGPSVSSRAQTAPCIDPGQEVRAVLVA